MEKKFLTLLGVFFAGSAMAGQGIDDKIDRSGFFSDNEQERSLMYKKWCEEVEKNANKIPAEKVRFRSEYDSLIQNIVEQKEKFYDERVLKRLRLCVQVLGKKPDDVRDALEEGWMKMDRNEEIPEELAEMAWRVTCDLRKVKG